MARVTRQNPRLTSKDAASQYAPVGAVVRPVARLRSPSLMQLATSAGSLNGTYAAGSTKTDTDYVQGAASVKVISDGAAGTIGYTWPVVSWNMSDKFLRVVCKIDDYTNMNYATIDVGTGGGFTNRFTTALGENFGTKKLRVAREGEWCVLDYPRDVFTVGAGTPDWSAVTHIRMQGVDKNGVAMTIRVNSVSAVTELPALPNGAMVLCLDDSDASQYTIARPRLDMYGFKATLFPIVESLGPAGMSVDRMKALRDMSGWEVGIHAMTIADHSAGLTGLTETQLKAKFDEMKSWASAQGFASDAFAWPLGESDAAAEAVAKQYVSAARMTSIGTQSTGIPNAMRLKHYNLGTRTLAQTQTMIDNAKAGKNLCIMTGHRIVVGGATGNDILQSVFEPMIDYAASVGMPFMTMTEALRTVGAI